MTPPVPLVSRRKPGVPTRMLRPRGAMLGGVCAGVAEHMQWPVNWVRAGAVVFTLLGGGAALLYVWLWALTPLEPATGETDAAASAHRAFPVAPVLVGFAAVAAVIALVTAVVGAYAPAAMVALAALVLTAAAVAWSLLFDRNDPKRSERYGVATRTTAAVGLALTGVLLLATSPPVPATVIAVVMIVGAAGVLAAPAIVRLWTSLLAERAARAQEESRAEVAAHLHDSVLQTLALIQNRAGASSEIARIARAQEHELRDWLFAGTKPSDADFAAQLREVALELELQHAVRFDVVTTGDFTDRSFPAVLAAAREAMLNAARHAGGEVSVYVELSASDLDVYIRDRGPGFDIGAMPEGRMGVRGSIIGRMARHGGTATVTSDENGTQVHLHSPVVAHSGSRSAPSPQSAPEPSEPRASSADTQGTEGRER